MIWWQCLTQHKNNSTETFTSPDKVFGEEKTFMVGYPSFLISWSSKSLHVDPQKASIVTHTKTDIYRHFKRSPHDPWTLKGRLCHMIIVVEYYSEAPCKKVPRTWFKFCRGEHCFRSQQLCQQCRFSSWSEMQTFHRFPKNDLRTDNRTSLDQWTK